MAMRSREILAEFRTLVSDPSYAFYTEINQAYREILRLTHWNFLRAQSQNLLALEASRAEYTLDTARIRRLEAIWLKKNSGQQEWVLLEEVPPERFEEFRFANLNSDGNDDEGTPKVYVLRGGSPLTVTVSPTPDTAFTTRIDYIEQPENLDEDTSPVTPAAYDDTITLLGAGYRLEREADAGKRALGDRYIARALGQFDQIVRDVHPNRTANPDRTQQRWLR